MRLTTKRERTMEYCESKLAECNLDRKPQHGDGGTQWAGQTGLLGHLTLVGTVERAVSTPQGRASTFILRVGVRSRPCVFGAFHFPGPSCPG